MKDFQGKTTKVETGSWTVFLGLCKGCGICLEKCPQKAIIFGEEVGVYTNPVPKIDPQRCNLCGVCEISCPDCAIRVEKNV